MTRYFKDTQPPRPGYIPDTHSEYCYYNGIWVVSVLNPTDKWLALGLEEIAQAEASTLSNGKFN